MHNDTEEILAFLEYIRSQNRMVSIVNTFKGVSYSLNVKILNVSTKEGTVTVSTQPSQHMSVLPNIQVNINSELFPFMVNARVASVDNIHKVAVLHQLAYERSADEQRLNPRITHQEKLPIRVHLENGGQYEGMCDDISIEGISVLLKDLTAADLEVIRAGNISRLVFALHLKTLDRPHIFTLPGKIIYTNSIEGGKTRLGMQTYPQMGEQTMLRQYIFDRQTEMFTKVHAQTSGE